MNTKLISVLCSVLVVLFFSNANNLFAFSVWEFGGKGNPIQLSSFEISELYEADGDTMDKILYPSGMQLPTKYMDVLDFVPYKNISINNIVGDFLNKYFSNAEGKFTYAEYKAAERFVYFRSMISMWDESNVIVNSLSNIKNVFDWSMDGYFTVPVIEDATKLNNLFKVYGGLFEELSFGNNVSNYSDLYDKLFLDRGRNIILTLGAEFIVCDLTHSSVPMNNVVGDYSEFLQNYPNIWNYLGIRLEPSDFYIDYDSECMFNKEEIEYIEFIESKSFLSVDMKKEEAKEVPTDNKSEYEIKTVNEIVSNSSSFNYNHFSTKKKYNFRDYFVVISFIFVFVSISIFWVIHTINVNKDPLRKRLR